MMNKQFSFMTDELKQYYLKLDKDNNGEYFNDCTVEPDDSSNFKFTYWVQAEKSNIKYRWLVGEGNISMELVNQNGKWLQALTTPFDMPYDKNISNVSISFDLTKFSSYEDFIKNYTK